MDVELVAKWFTPFNSGVIEYSLLSDSPLESGFNLNSMPTPLPWWPRNVGFWMGCYKLIVLSLVAILITNYPSIHPDPPTHPSIPIHPSIYLQCPTSSHPSDRVWFFRFFYQTFHASNLVSILFTLLNCMHCK